MLINKSSKIACCIALFVTLSGLFTPIYAEPAQEIAKTCDALMQFLMSQSKDKQHATIRANIQKKFHDNLTKLLNERFSINELKEIEGAIKKAGGNVILKGTQVFVDVINEKLQPGKKIEDIELTISPAYNTTLDKVCSEKNAHERLKNIFIQYHKQKNIPVQDGEADRFATIAVKHVKKAIADNYTEEQFCSWYTFEHSELGKRLGTILAECIARSMI